MKHFQNPMLLLLCLFAFIPGMAQDSSKTLSAEQFAAIVRQYHPVVLQARNDIEQAESGVLAARGFFDPSLETVLAEKMFDGKRYYRYIQPQITLPTWYGIELYAGAENLSGTRLNPEETAGRTSYAGISIPLLKDLIIDKRRAALQQAKILHRQSEVERRIVLNNLLRDAIRSYWDWVQQHLFKATIDRLVTINEKRLELIRTSYHLGERPAIDTVEALAQLQTFQSLQQEQNLALQNAVLELSFFLWKADSAPYQLPQDIKPASLLENTQLVLLPTVDSLLHTIQEQHPELQQYNLKLAGLTVEQRLKLQGLLPRLDLKYNQLGYGYNVAKTAVSPLRQNNYQYGVSFALPLRLSQGRGEYRMAKLKLKNAALDRAQKAVLIQNKIKAYLNKIQALQQQLVIQKKALQNYTALQRAEETRFFSGESSLFLINSREAKVLEAEQKQIQLQIKYQQALIDLRWAAGILY